jgi:hypothetical protein
MIVRHLAIGLLLGAVVAASGCTGCCHRPAAVSAAPPCGCPGAPVPAGVVAPAGPAAVPAVPAVPAAPSASFGSAAAYPNCVAGR